MNEQARIKAIETEYRGYRFRSRLEARYAVYFDSLGIKWDYELEGFELGNGMRYLPDFYLPEFDLFVEIKSNENLLSFKEIEKILHFSQSRKIALIFGTPGSNGDCVMYAVNTQENILSNLYEAVKYGLEDNYDEQDAKDFAVERALELFHDTGRVRFGLCPLTGDLILQTSHETPYEFTMLRDAARAARAARFEFGG